MKCIGGPIDGAEVSHHPREGDTIHIGIVKDKYLFYGDPILVWKPAAEVKGVAESAVRAVYRAVGGVLRHVRTFVGSQQEQSE